MFLTVLPSGHYRSFPFVWNTHFWWPISHFGGFILGIVSFWLPLLIPLSVCGASTQSQNFSSILASCYLLFRLYGLCARDHVGAPRPCQMPNRVCTQFTCSVN